MTEREVSVLHKPPFTITNIQLSAMDVLVLTTMKNAAKCDTKSELQNPVNLYVFERMLRFRVLLEACLFECLFSPLASPPRQTEGALADFGLSDRVSLRGRSTQVERRRATHFSVEFVFATNVVH